MRVLLKSTIDMLGYTTLPGRHHPWADTLLGRHPLGRHPFADIPNLLDSTGYGQQASGMYHAEMHTCM